LHPSRGSIQFIDARFEEGKVKKTERPPAPFRRPVIAALAASALAATAMAANPPQAQSQSPSQSPQPPDAPPPSQSPSQSQSKPHGHMSHMSRTQAGQAQAEQLIQRWPSASQKAAKAMLDRYGEPDVVTDEMLVWYDNGPWLRSTVYRKPVPHNFPLPHEDVLEQVVAYEVPPEKLADLARFDGSLTASRTKGELAALCGEEAANFLALNLAHDIIEGRRDVEEAREFYAEAIQALMQGRSDEYVQELRFEPQTVAATTDPDEQVIQERVAGATEEDRQGGAAAGAAAAGAAAGAAGAASVTGESTAGRSIASMLGEQFSGKTVMSSDGEKVGEVSGITSDQAGRYVASIDLEDGFLGIGQEQVTLPLSALTLAENGNLQVAMDREQIEAHARKAQGSKDSRQWQQKKLPQTERQRL